MMDHFCKPLVEQVELELERNECSKEFTEKVANGLVLLEKINYNIKELTVIANLPVHLQTILLSLASTEALQEYRTYTSQSINLKELERVATGRMIPPLGWPNVLPPKLLHVQAIVAYDQALTLPEEEEQHHYNLQEWEARMYARVVGMIGLRAGTFPPVLPARVVFSPFNLTTVCGAKTWRIGEELVPAQVHFGIGVDTAAMILLAGENRTKVSWEWIASLIQQQQQPEDEAEVLLNARFSGFIFGAALTGLKLPLPFVYNLLLRSADAGVKAGILAALGFGGVEGGEEVMRLLRLSSPFHGVELQPRGECTPQEHMAALFSLTMLKKGTGDRQLLHDLFSLLDSPYSLFCAFGIGLIARSLTELTDAQVERIMRAANGAGVTNIYAQIAAILILLLLGDEATAEIILTDSRDVGHVRFLKQLARIWLSPTQYSRQVEEEEEQQDPWTLSAHVLYLAFMPPSEERTSFLKHLDVSVQAYQTYEQLMDAQGWQYMEDVRITALGVLLAGSGDLEALRIIRTQLQTPFAQDYGSTVGHMQALGMLCLGTQRFALDREQDRKLLLLSILPWWQDKVESRDGFTLTYPHYYRYLFLQLIQRKDSNLKLDRGEEQVGIVEPKELALVNRFTEWCGLNGREWCLVDPLEVAIKLAQCTKPSLHVL